MKGVGFMNLKDVYVVLGEYIYPDGKRGGSDIWGVYSSLDAANKSVTNFRELKMKTMKNTTHFQDICYTV